ncbi:hypothetical protein PBRA_004706 [Plasmodiophora brassicae]|uniref:Kinesin-like protein n=1 Tax=Plasmodiophora brassicae TaxID=37360 RepID=A0A0G4IL97_PLABS|nr:hypothetical protein PBRA_004706 [Plasmodiophora brassicae]
MQQPAGDAAPKRKRSMGETSTCPQTALAMALHRVYNTKLLERDRQIEKLQGELRAVKDHARSLEVQVQQLSGAGGADPHGLPAAHATTDTALRSAIDDIASASTALLASIQEDNNGLATSLTSRIAALKTLLTGRSSARPDVVARLGKSHLCNHITMLRNGIRDVQRRVQCELSQFGNDFVQQMESLRQEDAKLRASLASELDRCRKLNNDIIDLRGNIRVLVRLRPPLSDDQEPVVACLDQRTVTLEGCRSYEFDHVFGSRSTQLDVWKEFHPLIQSCVEGYHVTVMSYGKTYTMSGDPRTSTVGLIQRAIICLFDEITKHSDVSERFSVSASFVEIYNDTLRDLLGGSAETSSLRIRGDNENIHVAGLSRHRVSTPDEVLVLCDRAAAARQTSSTALNQRSSRSHSIVMLQLEKGGVQHARLTLVDLAGSERVARSEVTGSQLKEAGAINRSLSALGNVMSALYSRSVQRRKGASAATASIFVPYRNSALTHLLQESLSGDGRTVMLCHLSPDAADLPESVCTAKFAHRVRKVELGELGQSSQNGTVATLRKQISSLETNHAASIQRANMLQAKLDETLRLMASKPTTRTVGTVTPPFRDPPQSSVDRPLQASTSAKTVVERNANSTATTPRRVAVRSSSAHIPGTARRLKNAFGAQTVAMAGRVRQRKENVRSGWNY